MNTGVSMTPCGVCNRPRLAAPSVANSSKRMDIHDSKEGTTKHTKYTKKAKSKKREQATIIVDCFFGFFVYFVCFVVPLISSEGQAVLRQFFADFAQRGH